MTEEYHIRVKKEYAALLIEHLRKEDAIELIDDNSTIPEWQKEAVRKTLQQIQENPSVLQSWDIVKQKYMRH